MSVKSKAGGFREGSGRPKGSLGEKTLAVQEKLQQLNCDPIEALANISMDTNNTPELRFQANKELAQYVAPKIVSGLVVKTLKASL